MKRFTLDYIIETERCILKIPQISEAEYIWNLITEDVTENMLWEKGDDFSQTYANLVKTRKNAELGESWDAAIYLKETGKCIGRCGLPSIDTKVNAGEIGYWLSPEYWGKGIVPECVNKLIEIIFTEFNYERISLNADAGNAKSRRVAEKCGFQLDGVLRKYRKTKGTIRDVAMYSIIREEYKK